MKTELKYENPEKVIGDGYTGLQINGLPENCTAYSLYIVDPQLKSQDEIRLALEDVRRESLWLTENLLEDYIWQNESFHLDICGENEGLIYLHGQTNYGDSIEDEWLIVYLLTELSKTFEKLWIKVVDTDGELLLIEAANALPRWLNPEIADNRVWIHNNKLYIIPLCAAHSSSESGSTIPISRSLRLEEGIEILRSRPEILINSPTIEQEAFYRLRNYPLQIYASLHHALICIPRNLAYILQKIPAAISPAIRAFYLRDPISLKFLLGEKSSLLFKPEDLVMYSTRFTKLLFAQLKHQEFSAPPAWSQTSVDALRQGNVYYEQWKLGMKLTCGFEILIRDVQNGKASIVEKLKIFIEDTKKNHRSNFLSDKEISDWNEKFGDDDQSWMDIDYRDFERELSRNSHGKDSNQNDGEKETSGFGDAKTHTDLKKIVERFKSFLNDDKAGLDGAEIDDMDIDDKEDSTDEYSTDNDEDDKISFDKNEFSRIMREVMSMSSEEGNQTSKKNSPSHPANKSMIVDEEKSLSENKFVEEIKKETVVDLEEFDVPEIYKPPRKSMAMGDKKTDDGMQNNDDDDNDDNDDDDNDDGGDEEPDGKFDIDFNLAKNLLGSFKAQAGLAGPGGNLLGMMGIHLPRDDGKVEEI